MKVEASPRYGAAGTGWLRETLPANRSDLLVALVSRFNHDLRTPLNTIAGWAHLLQTSAADVARVRHVSEVFARNVREQTLLLEEFVDDARALLGVLALNSADISAAQVVSAAADRVAPSLDMHDVRLDAPHASDLRLHADLARTQRLLYRLLLLAVRRAPEAATVKLRVFADDPCVAFVVEAPAARSDFEDAQLLDLRIASAVTALADGTLDIGPPEHGTHFDLRLPLAAE
jgi:K+-sensing histidine kinase KdpD